MNPRKDSDNRLKSLMISMINTYGYTRIMEAIEMKIAANNAEEKKEGEVE